MLLHKVERKIEFFQSDNAYSAHAEEVVEQLKVVQRALKRLIDDVYYDEAVALNCLESYSFKDLNKEDIRKICDMEDKLRKKDIKVVFSEDVSNQIERWWD